jgi:hypothetical protein
MMKVASLKDIQFSKASPGHLLLFRQEGEKFAIPVHGAQPRPALGFITLSQASPILRWLNPQAADPICVDLGPVELVFAPTLEAFSSGSQHYRPGALIIETDGPALVCFDPTGTEKVRVGISDWRLRTDPVQNNFYILQWQLGLPAIEDKLDVVYTRKPPQQGP